MLDEPTDSTTPNDQGDATPAPAKAPRRRRATKVASPAAAIVDAAQAATGGSSSEQGAAAAAVGVDVTASAAAFGATGDAPAAPLADETAGTDVSPAVGSAAGAGSAAGEVEAAAGEVEAGDGVPTPAKRVRKAPAKRAASPRKRAAKSDDAPVAVDGSGADGPTGAVAATPSGGTSDAAAPAEDVPTEEELAEQAGPLPGEPVVTAVEDDPVVAEAVADEVSTLAVTDASGTAASTTDASCTDASTTDAAPAPEEAPAPVKRTRARRPTAVVTFQAPVLEPEPEVEPTPAATVEDADADAAATPRRRRRAGTSGALPPSALVPQLIEPVPLEVEPEAPEVEVEVEADSDDDEDGGDRPRRRRRGRRGRGPRRPEDEGDDTPSGDLTSGDATAGEVTSDDVTGSEVASEDGSVDEPADEDAGSGAAAADEDDDDSTSGTRRRRRRRRSGSTAEDADEAASVVTQVREPRTRSRSGATGADEDGVRGITGSTRMAAKRVRRQEGRDSGRKRTAILSEAEFLARREAVERTMIVRQKGDRTQIAVLEDGILVEHYVTKASAQSYAGNVYLGRVQNVLPSMEAAFVDIGKSRNAVLYAGEVNYAGVGGGKSRSIESVLKSGQEVLVQVSKDPIGHKGARLTGQVSLPGRYLVYVPEGSMTGISRKLPEPERERLKKILKKVVPDDAGVIIRTAAEGASEEEISGDVRRLQAQWEVIRTKADKGGAPVLLHAEPDLVIRVVRDVFNEDFSGLVVQGDTEWDTIRDYVEFVAPDLAPRLSRHTAERDVFAEHRVDEQLLKALDRKVYLPSGGSLVIDRTEAMVVIDVNTGKFVGKGGNLEETVTRNNLEAAEEIARQLRLRDVGGIIVVDFIDMVLESNRELVVRRLVECLGRDRTKHQVAEVTSLGLVQMTRKRVGQGLLESFSEPCESCNGRGVHVHPEPVDERRGSGGGGEDGRRDRAPRVRASRPLPPDAPRPGAGIAAMSPAATDAAPPAEEGAPPPRRRRRGGRGTGAATVAPDSELQELLADASPAEQDAVAAAIEVADATVEEGPIAQTWGATSTDEPMVADPALPGPAVSGASDPSEPEPDVADSPTAAMEDPPEPVPDIADQPTSAMEDLPADLAPNEVVGAIIDAELEIGTGLPGAAVEPSAPDQPEGIDEPTPAPTDGPAAAPADEPGGDAVSAALRDQRSQAPADEPEARFVAAGEQSSVGEQASDAGPDPSALPAPDGVDLPAADLAGVPAVGVPAAAVPRRRRRATSRPAGPPTV